MIKLAAFVALMIASYLLMIRFVPISALVAGFTIGATFIAYWWCAALVWGVVAWRAIF